MDFGWDKEHIDFREEVRAFIKQQRTPELVSELRGREMGGGPAYHKFRAALAEKGWLKMCWPAAYGGKDRNPIFQYILVEEMEYWGMPYGSLSVTSIAPAIMAFGSEAQKSEHIPAIMDGRHQFAIGYTEPNAGTDLASLETRATRDGDEYVINGQKIYTSGAESATHVWLAARTDPDAPKHRGVSLFIVPMSSPGLSVRPLWTMAGVRTNETFYEDVRVPSSAIVGELNRGWYIVMHALDHERVGIGPSGSLARSFDALVEHLGAERPEVLRDPISRRRLAEMRVDLEMQRALARTNAWIISEGRTPTMEASMVKVWSSELRTRLHNLGMDLLGRAGGLRRESGGYSPMDGRMEASFRASPILRFGGGTNEIQRSIIANRGLGLPR